MKAHPWPKILILTSALAGGFGCSKADNDTKDATAAPLAAPDNAVGTTTLGETGLGAIPCEQSWTSYVAGHPQGLVLNFTTVKQSTGADGTVIDSSRSNSEDVVIFSSDEQVTSKRTTSVEGLSQPVVTTTTAKRSNWVTGCNQLSAYLSKIAFGGHFEITEKSPQSIDVPAGSFATEYLRGKTTGLLTSGATTFQIWNMDDGSGIPVKAVIETTATVADADLITTSTTELVKLTRP